MHEKEITVHENDISMHGNDQNSKYSLIFWPIVHGYIIFMHEFSFSHA